MNGIFIGLGSSLGDAETTFRTSEQFLSQKGIQVLKKSKNLLNEPYGGVAKNKFTNAVWQIDFPLTAWEKINFVLLPDKYKKIKKSFKLLKILQQCENFCGRVRNKKWEDRTLDLDILMFDDLILEKRKLKIPHPEISKRDFVLKPWLEIVDESFVIPRFGSLKNCLEKLNDH